MEIELKSISLSKLQISNTIVALQEYIKILRKEAAEDPQGGEHEDILIAESVIAELVRAKRD